MPVGSGGGEPAGRYGFWPLALLWLPGGFVASAVIRFGWLADPATGPPISAAALLSLLLVAPCGLPLALACRGLWRLGRRGTAWAAAIGLGALTVAAGLFAGLLGPLAIAVYAVVLSLPAWIVWWLARRKRQLARQRLAHLPQPPGEVRVV